MFDFLSSRVLSPSFLPSFLPLARLSNSQGVNIQLLGTTTVLMIANVTEEDYGNYTCVASNRLGVQNASLFLYRPGMGRDNGSACKTGVVSDGRHDALIYNLFRSSKP
ncbi:hypothetical protein NHX12_008856, partial [Muraenolepis orangiensis]